MTQGDLLKYVVETLDRLAIPFMIAGSFASGAFGEPRMTQDIDVVIDPDPAALGPLCEEMGKAGLYVSVDAARSALDQRGMFNAIDAESGNKVDFVVTPATQWGRQQMRRRRRIQIMPGLHADVSAPEDTIVSKLRYYNEGGSDKHLRDIAGILRVTPEVDIYYVTGQVETMGLADTWEEVLRQWSQSR